MEIPSIRLSNSKLPKALDMPSIPLKTPSADMPVFPPIVIPPQNLEAPKGVELDEAEEERLRLHSFDLAITQVRKDNLDENTEQINDE